MLAWPAQQKQTGCRRRRRRRRQQASHPAS